MAVEIIQSNNPKLTAAPDGADLKMIVGDLNTGKYHIADIPEPGDGGGGGSSIVPAEVKDGNFSFDMAEDTVLEYMTFRKNATLNIKIGTTNGGEEIWSGAVDNPGPVELMYYCTQDETIYVSGITAGTIVKTKIS
jgi:hypothetical protein